ncbi:hypothetical protein L249_6742 [Ophiocordyceps polyrhachis-furcata BCC 54312]|uniref:Cell wall protein n=1 Tax=Ophiocordyceps polyrhachis-furcata BCC 54312 TaxID=1330021 RepID=A0A367LKF3_9HYPO|nr:hypothetical protein L249_6742 [Ophiocordyceps polyrhachis-furcata BCC 54312]
MHFTTLAAIQLAWTAAVVDAAPRHFDTETEMEPRQLGGDFDALGGAVAVPFKLVGSILRRDDGGGDEKRYLQPYSEGKKEEDCDDDDDDDVTVMVTATATARHSVVVPAPSAPSTAGYDVARSTATKKKAAGPPYPTTASEKPAAQEDYKVASSTPAGYEVRAVQPTRTASSATTTCTPHDY